MRWWLKRTEGEHDGGQVHVEALVRELTQHFSRDAAVQLQQRGWHPDTPEQRMALAVARGDYDHLVHCGDKLVPILQRSASVHQWCPEVIRVLMTVGTSPALACLADVVVERWRSGQWHDGCAEALKEPSILSSMLQEFYATLDVRLARILEDAGWTPNTVDDQVALAVASGDLARASSYGEEAVPMLRRALAVESDTYPILEALADTHSAAGAAVVIEALREQWKHGVSRWTDSELVARCGSAAVGPLIDLLQTDPTHAVLAEDLLAAVMAFPDTISTEDLLHVASMEDPVHVYQLPDDARIYENRIDCSRLKTAALAELERRGFAGRE